MASPSPLRFLNSTPVRLVSFLLVLHTVVLYAVVTRQEYVPNAAPLSNFPTRVADWNMVQEGFVDEETMSVLRADDTLTRTYARPTDRVATNLFIAAFRSQRTGKAPHSPKNCLPGAGWVQSVSGMMTIDVPQYGPIEVNRYEVSKGDVTSVVLYWYQSHARVVASEYEAKVYVVMDSLRHNRTDTALVRIVVPVVNKDSDAAVKTATDFVKSSFGSIKAALPN